MIYIYINLSRACHSAYCRLNSCIFRPISSSPLAVHSTIKRRSWHITSFSRQLSSWQIHEGRRRPRQCSDRSDMAVRDHGDKTHNRESSYPYILHRIRIYARTDLCSRSRRLLEQSLCYVLNVVRSRVRLRHVQLRSKNARATRRHSARSTGACGGGHCYRAKKTPSAKKRTRQRRCGPDES